MIIFYFSFVYRKLVNHNNNFQKKHYNIFYKIKNEDIILFFPNYAYFKWPELDKGVT